MVKATPLPLHPLWKDLVTVVQKAAWDTGPLRTSAKDFAPTRIRFPTVQLVASRFADCAWWKNTFSVWLSYSGFIKQDVGLATRQAGFHGEGNEFCNAQKRTLEVLDHSQSLYSRNHYHRHHHYRCPYRLILSFRSHRFSGSKLTISSKQTDIFVGFLTFFRKVTGYNFKLVYYFILHVSCSALLAIAHYWTPLWSIGSINKSICAVHHQLQQRNRTHKVEVLQRASIFLSYLKNLIGQLVFIPTSSNK